MKNILSSLLLLLASGMAFAQGTSTHELLVELKTSLYDDDGADNIFSMALGSTEEGTHVTINCGNGSVDLAVAVAGLDEDSEIVGTSFSGHVSAAGKVRIYGDPNKIDYLNFSGCSISEITFHQDLKLQLLNLEHNNLGKVNINPMKELQVLYIMDNPFDVEPFNITDTLSQLAVLEIGEIENIDPSFNITKFPALQSFDAYHTLGLKHADSGNCPLLRRLSLEMTGVDSIDVTNNPLLQVLNVSETRVRQLNLSQNAALRELYCTHGSGTINTDVKLTELDVTNNPLLTYLFCGGNHLTELDLSQNAELVTLSCPYNWLTGIVLNQEQNPELYSVNLNHNRMNFRTLPAPQETWGEYYHDQDDLVLNDTYKVGDVIDFSDQVLREGTQTNGVMAYALKEDPSNLLELDSCFYIYEAGKLTLLKDTTLQLRMIFLNSLLCDYPLYTEPFWVRSVADFGKDIKALSIASITSTGSNVKMAIGIVGASAEEPVTIKVDFGDGTLKPYQITSEEPVGFNVTGARAGYANIDVYVPQDHYVSVFRSQDLTMSNINLAELTELRELSIENADLYSIDLSYNAKLEKLTLTGNPYLTQVSLKGASYYYYKGLLSNVNLSNNGIKSFEYDDLYGMKYLDLSNNALTEFDASDTDNLVEVNLSGNELEFLQFDNSEKLEKVIASDNKMYYIYITEEAPLSYLDVAGNAFAFGYMPENSWNLDEEHFIYAPQQTVQIAASSPSIDLSAYYIEIDGNTTQFVWKNADGSPLVVGTDYTITSYGWTQFLEPALNKMVYCEMSHASYPQFAGEYALCTSLMKVILNPNIELAHFTTTNDYDLATLALKGNKDNMTLYIDWYGDGSVDPYALSTNEVLYAQAYTKGGQQVRVLAAEEGDNFSVFSISGAKMSEFDGTGLTEAQLIGVEEAGLCSITLPASGNLMELKLSGNKFSSLDLTPYPNLYYFAANSNQFETFNLSQAPSLGLVFMANNKLTDVTVSGNNALWNLDLGCNKFSQIALQGAPNLEQIWLNGNQFETLNLDYLTNLKVLDIVDNYFTFATLEHFVDDALNVFHYGNQKDIVAVANGNTVDLSSQAVVCDSMTVYRWFEGRPEFDENNELTGVELEADSLYTVANGVTTFSLPETRNNLVCVMTNAALPNLYLFTQPLTITATGIECIETATPCRNGKEYIDGQIVVNRNGKRFNLHGVERED